MFYFRVVVGRRSHRYASFLRLEIKKFILQDCFKNQLVGTLVHRILSNSHIDLSDFSSAALSSIAVATATPHSSALHMRNSSCVNIADT